MAKQGKAAATLTPKLRFPAFRAAPGWCVKRMDRLYSFMRNNVLSRDKLNYEAGFAKNIHYGDIHTKFRALFDVTKERTPFVNDTEEVPAVGSEDYCIEGDIIFADASEDTNDVGKSMEIVHLNGEQVLSGQHTILARPKNESLIVGFGGYLFRSGLIRSRIKKEAQGTKVYQISSSRLGGIDITYPSDTAEQQKIADCLTSLDEVIAAQGCKVEALKAHKRGLMQQLFPREGETRPRLRFPDSDSQDWVTTRVAEVLAGRDERQSPSEDKPLFSLTIESGITAKTERYDRKFLVRADSKTYKLVRPLDIAYNPANLRWGAIAMSQLTHSVLVSPIYEVLFVKDTNRHSVHFVNYAISREEQIRRFAAKGQGSLIERIVVKLEDFLATTFLVPTTFEEEQRIADCLASIDTQIAGESSQLNALKIHKQGLMQQLFPAPEGG